MNLVKTSQGPDPKLRNKTVLEEWKSFMQREPLPRTALLIEDLALRVKQATDPIKEEVIRRVAARSRYSLADVKILWEASDRFLQSLPALVEFHKTLVEFENTAAPRGLWNYSIRLAPHGTILVCLPANAVVPLGIILSCALVAAGNRVVVAVSSTAREEGLLLLDAVQNAMPGNMLVWRGSVRQAIDEFVVLTPLVDALYYIGGSKQYADISAACAKAGVALIYEGEGQGGVILADELSATEMKIAANKLIDSKVFCLGQMCSAPNFVLISQQSFPAFIAIYKEECLKRSFGKGIDLILDKATREKLLRIEALLGSPEPNVFGGGDLFPFWWTVRDFTPLSIEELSCPGLIIIQMPDVESCFKAVASLRFRMQITLFSSCLNDFDTLLRCSQFARYCTWMNPADQDSLLPWGNYGRSGASDVLDFYRKGLRRIICEGNIVKP